MKNIYIYFLVFFTNNNKIAKTCKIFVFSLLENKKIRTFVYDDCRIVVVKHLITYYIHIYINRSVYDVVHMYIHIFMCLPLSVKIIYLRARKRN